MLRKHNFSGAISLLKFILKKNYLKQEAISLTNHLRSSFSIIKFDEELKNDEGTDHDANTYNRLNNSNQEIIKCQNVVSLMNFYSKNKNHLKGDEKFLILRVYGRLAKNANQTDFTTEFTKFMKEDIINSIDTFNEYSNVF